MGALLKALSKKKLKLKRSYEKWAFTAFLHPKTQELRSFTLKIAENSLKNQEFIEVKQNYLQSADPTVVQGFLLREDISRLFKNRYADQTSERILIHVPSAESSPAGFSLFTNLAECLNYLGVPTAILGWNQDSNEVVESFKPTVFLTSEHDSYLNRVDWNGIAKYKTRHKLKVGITAPLLENDTAPNTEKLLWAIENKIDFLYSFRDVDYVNSQPVYKAFANAGLPLLCLPWGANVLRYYPVPGCERDLDYVLIASRKREHIVYMKEIAKCYPGFIDGPGWNHINNFSFNRDRDRYIYSRAKVGLNIHLPEQLNNVYELNERTYQLAACGAPQLIDHPKLLDKTFSKEAIFIAENPKEYTELFLELINNPVLGQKAALLAQQEVFSKHTTFHRAEAFLKQLEKMNS
ncbi:glycosyltransferase family 1 protein [Polynucleobacter sp. 71A-WALBACH]|uniref:glycosyltransferase family protein n=1 Tax=Polynucleobacter sp. 71A-WALBACH TaxID=2689097 RepID=UPI001C0B9E73|nr:glycosyltransferase [Polynucleobacter sp. 71A-WALBACH]MBU3593254.1 glycosyltransferase family 1 protein [Polynucleobacter sp. 71A-WALBACH]